ncbi:hypothetical protein P691DRAFT_731203 [Macrolepiota fuliginosa MF-IS2]|uniref:Uncharacterized protein n=1 Tax=Macrolepiota fuliginosa MF-IS2 TaxID=1400762 RepID=A0A9P6C3C8_9AGAR|nr:hypothetical protein P691DRAFT_731203 [Macrolepiota fuliginosa MF-IS2]
MPWPGYIQQEAGRLTDTDEICNHFFPLYLDILYEYFPQDQFRICPYYATPAAETGGTHGPDDWRFTTTFLVETRDPPRSPVLFLEIIEPTALDTTRDDVPYFRAVDGQMRGYALQMLELLRIPRLYGISAIGVQLCYYVYDSAIGDIRSPPKIISDDPAMAKRWAMNLMDEEGHRQFMEMVRDIKDMLKGAGL